MRIAGTLSCSLCNGDGIRYVVFVQGCGHHCPGCHNPETWPFSGGYSVSVEELVEDVHKHPHIDGITLSGGDPFYQQEECCKLIDALPELNVWCYTGFEWEVVRDTPLVQRCDVVVTGPFVEQLKCEGKPYGSSNQEVHRIEREKRVQADTLFSDGVESRTGSGAE